MEFNSAFKGLRDITEEIGLKFRHVVFLIDSPNMMIGGLFKDAASNIIITQPQTFGIFCLHC
jgi:hypothetical protein